MTQELFQESAQELGQESSQEGDFTSISIAWLNEYINYYSQYSSEFLTRKDFKETDDLMPIIKGISVFSWEGVESIKDVKKENLVLAKLAAKKQGLDLISSARFFDLYTKYFDISEEVELYDIFEKKDVQLTRTFRLFFTNDYIPYVEKELKAPTKLHIKYSLISGVHSSKQIITLFIDSIVVLDEGDPKLHYNNGLEAMKDKDYDKAKNDLAFAIALDENYIDAYFVLGNVYLETKEYESAIENFQKVVRINPENFDAYYQLGYANIELKKYRQAIENLDKALALNFNDLVVYYELAFAFEAMQNPIVTISLLTKMLEKKQDYLSYIRRAKQYLVLGNVQMAKLDQKAALAIIEKNALEVGEEYQILIQLIEEKEEELRKKSIEKFQRKNP